jgi:hypothetical protein
MTWCAKHSVQEEARFGTLRLLLAQLGVTEKDL